MMPTAFNALKQLLDIAQFRWLVMGNTALYFGFFGAILLRSLLAWHLTQDEMALAYINVVSAVCMFVMTVGAGTIIDRLERRRMLFVAQLFVAAAEAAVLLLLLTDQLSFMWLLLFSTVASIAYPFIMPARTAMLVAAVSRDQLTRATAFLTAGVNIARMLGPAMMGIFAEVIGFVFCYCLLLVFHAASISCTLQLAPQPAVAKQREGFIKETLAGFSYIIKRRSLGLSVLYSTLPFLVVIPMQNLMVVFVEELWHLGGSGAGIIMAAMGVGGLMGSLYTTMLKEGSFVKRLIPSTLVMALFMVLFANSPNFWIATVMVLGIYSASVMSNTLVTTAIQLMTEDHVRGRVSSISLMSLSLAPIGIVPLAYATKHIGASWALTGEAVCLALVVVLFWMLPSFRRVDEMAKTEQA